MASIFAPTPFMPSDKFRLHILFESTHDEERFVKKYGLKTRNTLKHTMSVHKLKARVGVVRHTQWPDDVRLDGKAPYVKYVVNVNIENLHVALY